MARAGAATDRYDDLQFTDLQGGSGDRAASFLPWVCWRLMRRGKMHAAIYARVSTKDQHCEMQLTELREYVARQGWRPIEYVEKASGKAGSRRPVLAQLLTDARLKKFDVVAVWKIDRFGRSLSNFVENVLTLDQAGVRFVCPMQGIDTDRRGPLSKLLMNMLAVFAEFERDLIVDRVRAGVAEARRAGKHCGRPAKIFRRDKVLELRSSGLSIRAIAGRLKVPKSVVARALKACP